jgi:ribonuclease P protein subunit RPR2
MPKKNKEAIKHIARSRIENLFKQAEVVFKDNPALSNRYVVISRKLAMKAKIRFPRELKRRFCKHCYSYLKHGENARVRIRQGKVVISCYSCKKFTRIPLK